MIALMGGCYYYLHTSYSDHLAIFFEPITSTYRIPALPLHNVLRGYRVALALEVICLMIYLIFMQSLWKKYKQTKSNLQETNKKLETANHELEEANHQLQAVDRLAKQAAELDRLNKKLQHALQAQDLFVACVSHELRNPLNVMLGSLDLLEPYVKDINQMQLLNTCRNCGDSLLNLINNLLDVAKINAGKLEINEVATNMSSFLGELWAYTKVGVEKKGLQGCLLVDRHLPLWLNIDYDRLQQILHNLIGNAIKFTEKGSIKVIISWIEGRGMTTCTSLPDLMNRKGLNAIKYRSSCDKSPIDQNDFHEGDRQEVYPSRTPHILNNFISFEQKDSVKEKLETLLKCSEQKGFHTLKINIVDTGCGISEEAQKNLFEPFRQGDRSVTRKFGGTGLGLYITQQLISKMEGKIHVYSEENIGTNFCVLIPAQTVTPQEVLEKLHEEGADLQQQDLLKECRALVVDDGVSNQHIICSFLKKLNIHADTANNGKEGVELFMSKGYDYYTFITMDLQMPVMDGLTACKKIREYEKSAGFQTNIPIIIVTGNCTDQEKTDCLKEDGDIQANYFYRKPWTFEECKNATQFIINRRNFKRNRVLIVDDDPFNQMVLLNYLKKYGFKCDACSNGKEALVKLEQEKYEAVLMDCEMPHMNGYTATQHIKKIYPNILIIGITGNTEGKCIEKALESGMSYVETKPVNFQKLITLLSTQAT